MSALAKDGASQSDFIRWVEVTLGPLNSGADPVSAITAWLRSHFSYRPEANEVLRTVPWMWADFFQLGHIEGDCDDASIWSAAVFAALGYRVRLRAIRYSDPQEFQHVFAEVYRVRWVPSDLTVPPGETYNILESMVVYVA